MFSNQVAGVVGGERIDEGFIDFEDIDVQRVQIMQIRVAGAEIVDGNFIACFAERTDHRRGLRYVDKPALGHFDFDLSDTDRVAVRFLTDL